MTTAPSDRRPRLWRITALIAVTVLLHLLVINWGGRHIRVPAPAALQENTISVSLRTPPAPTQPVSLPVAKPAVKRKPKPKPQPPAPAPVASDTLAIATTTSAVTTDDKATAATEESADSAENTPADKADTSAADTPPKADTPEAPGGTHYTVDPPPPASLEYDVQATYNNMAVHGSGTITWKSDGSRYTIEGKAEDFFFTFLRFSSSGDINEFGVAPELYTEQRIRKSATNTHFHRDRKQISFSASTNTYPSVGGEQDRASVVWQLVAIGRGDPGKFAPGATIDLFVAGPRDGEVWRMQVIGEEDIRVPAGPARAWHVVRVPRPGSYEQQLDIWFAPQQQWYPLRLRFSETNGDFLEMSLSKLKSLPPGT
ncbi:DUF3108 domain-containing protein [Herbaspirillum autotrophicum]|uniref:DUF3108 domain-containing protein n=1 Tax=Herbaspirillum autotrophicum TaxID=180195 RepID=UPI00067ADC48|nr:DUF3108 domain-containing protein [Herbaspirillum autotrophicum]